MRKRNNFLLLPVLLLFVLPVYAQTVDELIEKNLNAHGGLAKLKEIQSMRMTGKMTLHQGMEAPIVFQKKRPHFIRIEFTVGGVTGIQAYDGRTAWAQMPFMGIKDAQKMPQEEAEDLIEEADFDGPLVDYKQKGHTVELLGKEDVEGSEAYKLKLTLRDGKVRYIYLDAETGLEVKLTSIIKREGIENSVDTFFSDYKEVEGLIFPFAFQVKLKDQPGPQYILDKVELNPQLDDSLFQMPAAVPQTQPAGR